MDTSKQEIITRFLNHVKGKKPDTSSFNRRHAGAEGHWLELAMGIPPNSSNAADLFGYEMKNHTRNKTTFGDWSANNYLFKELEDFSRDDFLRIFGGFNDKKNRYSWSGKPCPKINKFNEFGQTLKITDEIDISALYSFSQDRRPDKGSIVPLRFQQEHLVLAKWDGDSLKQKLEKKFNQKGWFICIQDQGGKYSEIGFGPPFSYTDFLELVSKGIAYFDSGMYQGNERPYSMWRADNNFWHNLIVERY